jgi:hypothetical protein
VGRKEWEAVRLERTRPTDLDLLRDDAGDGRLWVLSCELEVAPEAGGEALLWLELEDGWDVWLDGERVSRERRRAQAILPDVAVPLALGLGRHRLTVLVEDVLGQAIFGAQLTSGQNRSPNGIRPLPTLEPRAK